MGSRMVDENGEHICDQQSETEPWCWVCGKDMEPPPDHGEWLRVVGMGRRFLRHVIAQRRVR